MIKTKTTTETRTKTETVSVTCDLCGKEYHAATRILDEIHWGNRDEVECSCVFVSRYSTDDDGYAYKHTVRSYHICPKRFRSKLEPWLQAQGAKPTKE